MVRGLATAVGLSLLLAAGAAPGAGMGGHGGGAGMHGGFAHGGHDSRFAGHGFHGHGFHDGAVIVPFGFGYYAPYGGYYPYPPTPPDAYCNQLSPYYDAEACWGWYGG
jgi:hypothetical protein